MLPPQIALPLDQIATFCQTWRITELSLFGSVLRHDFRPDSDVDVLASFAADTPWSRYDWGAMQAELKSIFGRAVDLVDQQGLSNPFRRHAILPTRQVMYAA